MTPSGLLRAILAIAPMVLSACTSTDVLEPSAIVSADVAAAPQGSAGSAAATPPAAQTPAAAVHNGATASIAAVTRLQFAPIVGTPVEAAGPLSERLALRARERGIVIARADEPLSHVMKGYFSALPEGKKTTIVYVWDVLDGSGNRLHRIQGSEVVDGGKGWPSVSAEAMQRIADRTMEELAAWLGGRAG